MTETRRVVVASQNPGKVREIARMLPGWDVCSLGDFDPVAFPAEGGDYEANAREKALTAARAIGLPCVADDSGLEVDALGGAPGPYSARYGGAGLDDRGRYQKLLEDMKDIPADERSASFHSVIVLMEDEADPAPLVCHGIWPGDILTEPRGQGGFGYDPIFYVPSHDCASAELAPKVKNKISHRGIAMQDLVDILKEVLP